MSTKRYPSLSLRAPVILRLPPFLPPSISTLLHIRRYGWWGCISLTLLPRDQKSKTYLESHYQSSSFPPPSPISYASSRLFRIKAKDACPVLGSSTLTHMWIVRLSVDYVVYVDDEGFSSHNIDLSKNILIISRC